MRFIQRDGKVGAVTFVGDEARLLKNGEVVVGWTAGGVLADVPQGDGYVLEVRAGGVVTREEIAIGAVVVAMGQSNMTRWFQRLTAVPAAPIAYQLGDAGWGGVGRGRRCGWQDLRSRAGGRAGSSGRHGQRRGRRYGADARSGRQRERLLARYVPDLALRRRPADARSGGDACT